MDNAHLDRFKASIFQEFPPDDRLKLRRRQNVARCGASKVVPATDIVCHLDASPPLGMPRRLIGLASSTPTRHADAFHDITGNTRVETTGRRCQHGDLPGCRSGNAITVAEDDLKFQQETIAFHRRMNDPTSGSASCARDLLPLIKTRRRRRQCLQHQSSANARARRFWPRASRRWCGGSSSFSLPARSQVISN